jgi:hypothetical protein
MQNVIETLKYYRREIDLKNRFIFNFSIYDKIFSSLETEKLESDKNPFEQNVNLKWILSEKYKNNKEQSFIDFWIINIWGGIAGFKPNEKNIIKLQKFKKQLEKGKLTKDCFETISSLSKVSSFIEPENFVIYDSRVIYTLNWLILSCENQNGFKQKYFPMPNGRNKVITNFDMKTIINLSHIEEYENETELYIKPQFAYFEFCKFIKKNAKIIYGENAKPYELEMLLFTIADKEIFKDLKERIKITTGNRVDRPAN